MQVLLQGWARCAQAAQGRPPAAGRPIGAILRFLCFTGSVWQTAMGVAGMAAGLTGLVEAVSVAVPCSWHLLCAGVLAGSDKTLLPAATLLLPSSVCTP